MISAEWLHWYYLIYSLPAGAAILVLLMSGMGAPRVGLRGSHGALRLHLPRMGGHQRALTPHAPHAGHTSAAPRAGTHRHARHDASRPSLAPSILRQLLGFFGVGRAPLPIVLGSLLIGWGFFGLAATETLRPLLRLPALFMLPALAIATAGALVTARLFAELSARLLPRDESYALARDGLLGLTGRVVYPVTETTGRIHIYDPYHTLHVASARLAPGSTALQNGAEVIVVSAGPGDRYLLVEPLGFSTGGPAPRTNEARGKERQQ
jgi:membrane protein implicated in regulation of membrane protease activity